MEASGQGNAGQGDAGQAQQGEGEGQGFDGAQMAQTFEGFTQSQEEMRQQMQQINEVLQAQPWSQQQQGEPEQQMPELDLSQYGIDTDESQQIAQNITALAQQQAQEQFQQLVGPMQQEFNQWKNEQQAQQLTSEFPELRDPEVANKIAGPNGLARTLAEQMGIPDAAGNMGFIRLVYMAGRAAEMNQEQNADPERPAHLEGGAGAGPGGGQQGSDLKDAIFGKGAAKGGSVLPFGN